jgi:hypothetical protein
LIQLFASKALELPISQDALFVERAWQEWRCLDELAIAAYWLKDYQRCKSACEELLAGGKVPAEHRPRVLANLNFALGKLGLPQRTEKPEQPLAASARGRQSPDAACAQRTVLP